MAVDKLNVGFFKELFDTAKKITQDTIASSPIVGKNSNLRELATVRGLDNVKIGMSFEEEGEEVPEVADTKPKAVERVTLVINKLGKMVMELVSKMGLHEKVIKFNKEASETNKKELEELKEKVDVLKMKLDAAEQHTDEIQQRSMKGNIIISSPQRQGKPSLMVPRQKPQNQSGRVEMENATDMCLRLIAEKTGVEFHITDVSACHKLRGAGVDASYIVRIHNRRPGSAWEVLSAGLLTGKNFHTGEAFDKNKNIFINFQLTKKRGSLSKEVRNAKVAGSILKYGTDQNGKITVRVGPNSGWAEVTSSSSLQALIANPPVARPRAWQQQPRQQ